MVYPFFMCVIYVINSNTIKNRLGDLIMPSATTSNVLHHKFMEAVFHEIAFTLYSDLWIGLFTSEPTDGLNNGVEVVSGGTDYARVLVPTSAVAWSVNGLEYSNTDPIEYLTPTASWGTILGAGIFDQLTGGEMLYYAKLTSPKTVSNGDGAPKILEGQLRITRATC